MSMLFPEEGNLNKGAKGAIVTALHLLLIGAGFGEGIELDAEYGQVTVERTKEFQKEHLGFQDDDADGQCGPKTLDAIAQRFGHDLRKIPREAFTSPSVGVDLVG